MGRGGLEGGRESHCQTATQTTGHVACVTGCNEGMEEVLLMFLLFLLLILQISTNAWPKSIAPQTRDVSIALVPTNVSVILVTMGTESGVKVCVSWVTCRFVNGFFCSERVI